MEADARKYCEKMLPLVSRTFALGTSLLRGPLLIQVNVSYLICRIADSIEDTNCVPAIVRSNLLKRVAGDLCGHQRAELIADIRRTFPSSQFPEDEYRLLRGTDQVMRVYDSFSEPVRQYIAKCLHEMANGMAATVDREINNRLEGLVDTADIERYCYYVAGTVGKMLTRLFAEDRTSIAAVKQKLAADEIAFGLGLQLTNVLKGIFDDYHRGVVYLPKSLLAQHDLTIEKLFADPLRDECQAMVLSVVKFTRTYLDQAITYTLAIPECETDIRLFCALPILFALRTLRLAKQHPDILLRGEALKIKRLEVIQLHNETKKCIKDNERLGQLLQREKDF